MFRGHFYRNYSENRGDFTDYVENGPYFMRGYPDFSLCGAEIGRPPVKWISDMGCGGVVDISKDI